MDAYNERRVRRLIIGQRTMETILHAMNGPPGAVSLPRFNDLPQGANLHGVNYDWTRNSFWILVSHDSFGRVPDGEEIPAMGQNVECMQFVPLVPEEVGRPLLRISQIIRECPESNREWLLGKLDQSVRFYEQMGEVAAKYPGIKTTPQGHEEAESPLYCLDTATNEVSVVPPPRECMNYLVERGLSPIAAASRAVIAMGRYKDLELRRMQESMGIPAALLGEPSDSKVACPECQETGQYHGLNSVEPCKTCQPAKDSPPE